MAKAKMMTRVEKLYHSLKADQLFSEAKEQFPLHNGAQAKDAADYIVDRLAAKALPEKAKDELWEMVYAGLT